MDSGLLDPARLEGGNDFGKQCFGRLTVVAAEIADIDIERDGGDFRPGVQGEMRFGENDGASDARWLAGGVAEGMEQPSNHGQPVTLAGIDAISFQPRRIEQQARGAAAIMQIGDQVQAIHDGILLRFT